MPYIFKDIETYYEEDRPSGPGPFPLVVLIHGHSADLRMWQFQTPALVDAGFRVIRYDVRGHGKSAAPPSGYIWENYSADLRDLLITTALEWPAPAGRAHLVGSSMGGGIALQFALDHPERALSLTLVDTALPGFTYSEEFSDRVSELVDAVRREGVRQAFERLWLVDPLFDGIRRYPDRFQTLRDIVLDFVAADYQPGAIPEDYVPNIIDRLSEIKAPTLILTGEDDLPDFRLIAEILASNLPYSRALSLSGCGHLPPLEVPESFNDILVRFLKGRSQRM